MVYRRFHQYIRSLLPVYIVLFTAVIVSASSGSTGRLRQRMWSSRDGLNQNTVKCILRGPGDNLWLGTDFGLVRFDGVRFKTVAGSGPIKYINKVTSLLVTVDGTFLVGTSGRGVLRFDRKKERFTSLATAKGVYQVMLLVWIREAKYRTFNLSPKESRAFLKKLLETMEKEKPYLDVEMTLTRLAGKLGIGKEELFQVINREIYLNFNAFLNKYRIEEAKKKLLDPKENQYVILKIAHVSALIPSPPLMRCSKR